MLRTIANAFSVAEIRKKLAFTAAMLLLYRLGAYIPAPGVDLDAVKELQNNFAGGGILSGPVEVPGGSWVVQCTDPQSAIFALSGKRANDGIGYFERAASRDPADVRFGLRKRTDSTSS